MIEELLAARHDVLKIEELLAAQHDVLKNYSSAGLMKVSIKQHCG